MTDWLLGSMIVEVMANQFTTRYTVIPKVVIPFKGRISNR